MSLDFSPAAEPSPQWQASNPTPLPEGIGREAPPWRWKEYVNQSRERMAQLEIEEEDLNTGVSVHEMEVRGPEGTRVPIAIYSRNEHQYSEDGTPLDELWPVFVHFHGGGFMFGTTKSEAATCRRIAKALRILVIDVNYRHTPEHKWPAPESDAGTVMYWLFGRARELHCDLQKIILGGVGAGARLAMNMVYRWKWSHDDHQPHPSDETCVCPIIIGLVLGTPWIYIDPESFPSQCFAAKSRDQCRNAPCLDADMLATLESHLEYPKGQRIEEEGAYYDFTNWPKTLIMTAGNDMLRDDGLYLAGKLSRCGGRTVSVDSLMTLGGTEILICYPGFIAANPEQSSILQLRTFKFSCLLGKCQTMQQTVMSRSGYTL